MRDVRTRSWETIVIAGGDDVAGTGLDAQDRQLFFNRGSVDSSCRIWFPLCSFHEVDSMYPTTSSRFRPYFIGGSVVQIALNKFRALDDVFGSAFR